MNLVRSIAPKKRTMALQVWGVNSKGGSCGALERVVAAPMRCTHHALRPMPQPSLAPLPPTSPQPQPWPLPFYPSPPHTGPGCEPRVPRHGPLQLGDRVA